jgi:SAM-dependent methyltransferase
MKQKEIDAKNSEFWDELCGSSMARDLGITEITPESLEKFDQAYMNYYPYLAGYVTAEDLKNKKVLEIGLGYGTLGQFLVSQDCDYYGLDIAEGPVAMMTDRLKFMGIESEDHVRVGSALDIPFLNESFDFVYTIGCLHHTGNIPKSVDEVHRVLRPGGKAIVMLYNRHSYRQLVQVPYGRIKETLLHKKHKDTFAWVRSLYDRDSSGQAAPHTDYVTRSEVYRYFNKFSRVGIDSRNFDTYVLLKKVAITRESLLNNIGRIPGLDSLLGIDIGNFNEFVLLKKVVVLRESLLNNIGRILGLDLYIVAQK